MMQMISSTTSAIATTSVRRITGGNSPLLSGTGMPSCALGSWRSPGGGFVGEDLAAEGLAADGLAAGALAGEGLVGITLTMVFPCPKRRWKRQQRRRGPADTITSQGRRSSIALTRVPRG